MAFYSDVPSEVRCMDCQETVYGDDIRHLTIPPLAATRWVRVWVTFNAQANVFGIQMAGAGLSAHKYRYKDLRTTSLATIEPAYTTLLWDRYSGGLYDLRSGMQVHDWDILVQDMASPLHGNHWAGVDPILRPDGTPERLAHPPTFAMPAPHEQQPRAGQGRRLEFELRRIETPHGSWLEIRRPDPTLVWPIGRQLADQKYNRCPLRYLNKYCPHWTDKPHKRVHKVHNANDDVMRMRYGLSQEFTNWVRVHVEVITTVTKDWGTFLVKAVDPLPSDDDWRALEPNSPAAWWYQENMFTLSGDRPAQNNWDNPMRGTFSNMPVLGALRLRRILWIAGGNIRRDKDQPRPSTERYVRRIWDRDDNRFKLQFVEHEWVDKLFPTTQLIKAPEEPDTMSDEVVFGKDEDPKWIEQWLKDVDHQENWRSRLSKSGKRIRRIRGG